MIDINVSKEVLETTQASVVKKSVAIPQGALCRVLIYDIDSPKKAQDDARIYKTKLTILNGLDVRMAVTSYFEGDKKIDVVDYSNPEEIKLPQGETGFKAISWFRMSEKWLKFQKFQTIATEDAEREKEALVIFNLWLEKTLGIPAEIKKGEGGIMFNAFRTWSVTPKKDKDGKETSEKQYNTYIDVYDRTEKKRLTPEQINVEIISPDLTAKIWAKIESPDGTPF